MATYGVPRDQLRTPRKTPKEGTWFVASLAVIALVIVGTWLAARNGNDSSALTYIQLAAWITLVADGIIGGMVMSTRLGVRRTQARWREEARYHTTDSTLIRHLPNETDVAIRFDEIRGITETDEWLNVRASTGWIIHIPREVARYEELRTTLSSYNPITPPEPASAGSVASVLVAAMVVCSLMLLILTHEHTIRLWSGVTLAAALTWQYICAPLIRITRRTHR